MNNNQVTLHRMDLYERIWTTPISQLAPEYGLSDVGLAKICKRMEIPRPPVGYWRKLEVGKAPPKPTLKPLSKKGVDQVTINPVRHRIKLPDNFGKPSKISVPNTLSDPHPLIQKSLIALQKGKPIERGLIYPRNKICLDIKTTQASINRACLIMDTLVKALNENDMTVTVTNESPVKTIVTVEQEQFEIGIDERIYQKPHTMTPEEMKKYAPYYWGAPKYDYSPSGLLVLKIRDAMYYRIRHQWADGKVQRIENCLGEFIAGLRLAAKTRKERRAEELRRQEEWKLEEQRRAEMHRLVAIEKMKIEKLESDANNWEIASRITRYLGALEQTQSDVEGLSEWINWGRSYARSINPIENPESVVFGIEQYP